MQKASFHMASQTEANPVCDPRHENFMHAFLDHLEASGNIDQLSRERAIRAQEQTQQTIHIVLTELGIVSSADLLQAAAQYFSLPIVTTDDFPVDPIELTELPASFLKQNRLVVTKQTDATLTIATCDPFDPESVDAIAYLLNTPVEIVLCHAADLEKEIARLYPENKSEDIDGQIAGSTTSVDEDDIQRLMDSASEAPVIRFVNRIINSAVQQGASDIHIEPLVDTLRVRLRLDGVMVETEKQPLSLQAGVVSRIKVLAKLNIAERRLPQDGRAKFVASGREIDLRVSTAPVLYGESIVLRVLDKDQAQLDLNSLGFDETTSVQFHTHLKTPNGIILVTGPTGSGKTTTLYAALKEINSTSRKIFTIEDPVEYEIGGINQVQIKPEIGLDFPNALRSLLRQDPDVMMVGEMRDAETVRIGIQASLTGHLVLSTLHTNSAASAVTRLLDMHAEDYLLASTLTAVVAQRLVRKLCPDCSQKASENDQETKQITTLLLNHGYAPQKLNLRKPIGCSKCLGTGYRGRTTIYEVLSINDNLRRLIKRGVTDKEIEQAAREDGMQTMYENGLQKISNGQTTYEEVIKVTRL